jgi:hypothetical protein
MPMSAVIILVSMACRNRNIDVRTQRFRTSMLPNAFKKRSARSDMKPKLRIDVVIICRQVVSVTRTGSDKYVANVKAVTVKGKPKHSEKTLLQ